MGLVSFRSSSRRGYASEIGRNPRHVRARKLSREVQVRFAQSAGTIQTDEGEVHVRPGDAIMTGVAGEQWRVSAAHFASRYEPVPPTQAGEAGTYVSLRNEILALRMTEGFEVVLSDGVSRLQGKAGDWLVDYGDGSLGIVSDAIFQVTYEVMD